MPLPLISALTYLLIGPEKIWGLATGFFRDLVLTSTLSAWPDWLPLFHLRSLMGFSVFAVLQSCWLICGSHRLCVFSIFNQTITLSCFAHHRPSCSSRSTSACTRTRPSHLSDFDQQHKSVPFTSFPSLLKHIAPITKSPLDITSPYPLLPNLIPFRRRNTCPTPSHLTNHPAPISRPPLPTCI
jgi:hypothetical protein